MDKCVAIIPARGGSKRIPRKNIKNFHGKPLIAYSIEVAIKSNLFEKVIVTTDDEEIANIAQQYGAIVHNRPKHLADDYSATQPVIEDVLESLKSNGEDFDYYCTIYATAPLLKERYLKEGYEKLKNSDAVNAFSVTSMPFPIQRTFKITDNERCEMFWPEHALTRSQDLEEAYQDAGQFYWTNLNKTSDKFMFGQDSVPIVIPRYLVQDIDTLEDWERAEYMYQLLNQMKVFDIKRSAYYDGYINVKDFAKLKQQVKDFVDITPSRKSKGNGHASKKLPKDKNILSKKNKDVK